MRLVLTLGSSMKLGLAVEISPSVFREQLTSWDRMSHAASADSLLLSTWKQTAREGHSPAEVTIRRLAGRVYLEADILQVIGVPLDDLLDEVRVCGPQVRAGRLVQLKLEAAPQFRHVEGLVPAPAHLWEWWGEGGVTDSCSYCINIYLL